MNVPVYERTTDCYTAKGIIELLLDKSLPHSTIATNQPVSVQDNLVFIVDISKLDKLEDIRADDLGSWTCNGKRRLQCTVNNHGHVIDVFSQHKPRKRHLYALVK